MVEIETTYLGSGSKVKTLLFEGRVVSLNPCLVPPQLIIESFTVTRKLEYRSVRIGKKIGPVKFF